MVIHINGNDGVFTDYIKGIHGYSAKRLYESLSWIRCRTVTHNVITARSARFPRPCLTTSPRQVVKPGPGPSGQTGITALPSRGSSAKRSNRGEVQPPCLTTVVKQGSAPALIDHFSALSGKAVQQGSGPTWQRSNRAVVVKQSGGQTEQRSNSGGQTGRRSNRAARVRARERVRASVRGCWRAIVCARVRASV